MPGASNGPATSARLQALPNIDSNTAGNPCGPCMASSHRSESVSRTNSRSNATEPALRVGFQRIVPAPAVLTSTTVPARQP